MKATKGQAALFWVGCLLILGGLWMVWQPLAIITAGLLLISLATCLFATAKKEPAAKATDGDPKKPD